MTTSLETIAQAMQAFTVETFGLVYRGPKAVVVVSADGPELLVGYYEGPDGYHGETPTDGLIIPEEATEAQVLAAIRPMLRDAGRPLELVELDEAADEAPIDLDDEAHGFDAYDAADAKRNALAQRLGFYFPHPPIPEDVLDADYSGRCEFAKGEKFRVSIGGRTVTATVTTAADENGAMEIRYHLDGRTQYLPLNIADLEG